MEQEQMQRLERIHSDLSKTLLVLHEDGGDEAVYEYAAALCAALATPASKSKRLAANLGELLDFTANCLNITAMLSK
jgi:hypothetical protein